jgi:hypothetical protein
MNAHHDRHIDRHLLRVSMTAVAAALGGALLLAGPLTAGTKAEAEQRSTGMSGEGAGQGSQQGGESLVKQLPDRYKLSNWMDKSVQNPNGDKLGTVKELVMDDLGQVRYVIMESELLTGEKKGNLVAVPTGHFRYPLAREEHLVLDVTPQRMQAAPTFGSTEWPDMGQQTFSTVVVAYWVPEDETAQGQAKTDQQGAAMQQQGEQRQAASGDRGQGAQEQAAGMGGDRDREFDANRDMVYLTEEKNQLFDKLDKNENGVIDPDEAKDHQRVTEQFDKLDTFGNDAITRSEFAAFEIKEDAGKKESGMKQDKAQQQGM